MKFKKKKLSAEIFTGSMADVTFLLIIFFMVTSVFSATRGLDFSLPEDTTTTEITQEESIDVYIRPGETLSIQADGKDLTLEQLIPYVFEKLSQDAAKPVILRTDPEGTYGNMMQAFDELRRAKELWSNYDVATETWTPKYKDSAGKPLGEIQTISIPTQREIENIWSMLGVSG